MKSKILISTIIISVLIGIMGTAFAPAVVSAASTVWNSCTKVSTYCYYPGLCKSYIDTNGDKICDRSQPAPNAIMTPVITATNAVALAATPSVTAAVTIAANPTPLSTATAAATPAAISGLSISNTVLPENDPQWEPATANSTRIINNSYFLIPILLVSALLYLFSWVLAVRKKITLHMHRKIWNTALLVYGLVTILLGLLLTIRIETGFNPSLPFDMLFWHVEAGIAMGFVSLFHIIWHRKYFTNILKNFKTNPVREGKMAASLETNLSRSENKE